MTEVVSTSLATPRLTGFLMGTFAAIALTLAAVGIYGVLSYLVARRTHEIGIRLAVGADRSQVLTLVLKQGLTLAGGGIVVGLVAAFAADAVDADRCSTRCGPSDPETFVLVSLALVVVALAGERVAGVPRDAREPVGGVADGVGSGTRIRVQGSGPIPGGRSIMIADDLKYGWRQLIKAPGFSITAILTLGLAIGANTAVFSLVDAVLLKSMPYPQPERLGTHGRDLHARRRRGRARRHGADRRGLGGDARSGEQRRCRAVLSGLSAPRQPGRADAHDQCRAAARQRRLLPRARRAAGDRPRVHRRGRRASAGRRSRS